MIRYTVQLVAVTLFAIGLMWFVSSGEAGQSSVSAEPVYWADTTYIDTESPESDSENEPSPREKREDFLRQVKRLPQTAFNIRNHYMEEIESEELIKAGIQGMLSNLDRFSVLMEKKSYDRLMESTHGKYEGLGMQIDSREDRIVVVTPIEGTPAYRKGLRAGDIIMEIDGEDTEGMSTSDGADLMRGPAGTTVELTIKRKGLADLLEFELERAVIELKSVPYYGIIPGTDIGYVRLSRFAEETSHELREAVTALNEQDVSGLVFDLRSNGGGLLDQAKETAELFLDQGREIVYTKGRFEGSERHFYAEKPPLYPDKPLVILVNEGTASASEIVSGSVQDWDRGLIMGQTTYGKGLVQRIFPISNDHSMALKLTTARYFVPSGRCIQKPEKQVKHGSDAEKELLAQQEEEEGDSIAVSDKEVFYTNGGRIVYGGGGIVPDIELDAETYEPIEINLERQSMFFDFAIQYVADHPEVKPDLQITEEIIEEFREFVDGKDFDYKTSLQVSVEKLRETVDEDGTMDAFEGTLDSLKALVELEKDDDFDASLDYITTSLKREIVSAIAGQRGVYEEVILHTDKTIQKAIGILQSPEEYTRLMTEGIDPKAELN
jgi:carboxyl-terminal processing protease